MRPVLQAALETWHVPRMFSASAALTIAPALLVSVLTYRFIEEPCRAWPRRLLGPKRAAPPPMVATNKPVAGETVTAS